MAQIDCFQLDDQTGSKSLEVRNKLINYTGKFEWNGFVPAVLSIPVKVT